MRKTMEQEINEENKVDIQIVLGNNNTKDQSVSFPETTKYNNNLPLLLTQ